MSDKVKKVLDTFEQINRIPRCSKNEEKISQWLQQWGRDRDYEVRSDDAGNVVIRVPGTKGFEQSPVVVLQGHMDMVCEKVPNSSHDFSNDPIVPKTDGDWLVADGTTLGADNGIGLALAMVLAEDADTGHPPMELLFTVDEEQGLTGAARLPEDFVEGRILLNIDSEDEGVLTVGCSGGRDVRISLPVEREPLPGDAHLLKLTVGELRGGHSGIDIHKQRASANCLLARLLHSIPENAAARLVWLEGGSAHNAIARDAHAVIAVESPSDKEIQSLAAGFLETVKKEYEGIEKAPDIKVEKLASSEAPESAATVENTIRAVGLLLGLPHGVQRMSNDIESLVETSVNLATAKLEDSGLKLLMSLRSSVMSRLDELTARIVVICELAGAEAVPGNQYPAWEPDMESELLERCKRIYMDLFGSEPVIEVIHAGVECAILGAKYEGMDMISIGPTLENPHSPEERLHLPSMVKTYDYLAGILASYRQ